MVQTDLLRLLVCPESHAELRMAGDELIVRLNRAIAQQSLKNRGGQTVQGALGGGLVRADNLLLYPIVDDIPMMLIDEAIPLDQAALAT